MKSKKITILLPNNRYGKVATQNEIIRCLRSLKVYKPTKVKLKPKRTNLRELQDLLKFPLMKKKAIKTIAERMSDYYIKNPHIIEMMINQMKVKREPTGFVIYNNGKKVYGNIYGPIIDTDPLAGNQIATDASKKYFDKIIQKRLTHGKQNKA